MEDIFLSSNNYDNSDGGGGGKLGLGETGDTADNTDGGFVEVVGRIPSSPDLSIRSLTSAEASRYPFLKHICHHMADYLSGTSNCSVVVTCILCQGWHCYQGFRVNEDS
jgi:hypothetical protein